MSRVYSTSGPPDIFRQGQIPPFHCFSAVYRTTVCAVASIWIAKWTQLQQLSRRCSSLWLLVLFSHSLWFLALFSHAHCAKPVHVSLCVNTVSACLWASGHPCLGRCILADPSPLYRAQDILLTELWSPSNRGAARRRWPEQMARNCEWLGISWLISSSTLFSLPVLRQTRGP